MEARGGEGAMSNRRLPPRKTIPTPPAEVADPLNGSDSPEAIAALEKAVVELVRGTNLSPEELVRGLLTNEGDRQALERGFAAPGEACNAGSRSGALTASSSSVRMTDKRQTTSPRRPIWQRRTRISSESCRTRSGAKPPATTYCRSTPLSRSA